MPSRPRRSGSSPGAGRSLLAAGYDQRHALKLALRPDVDLHLAVGLGRAGCPPETAARILLKTPAARPAAELEENARR